jgi:prepilin-type N-terminal cleavage/methylation domain-containing protein
MAHRAATKTNYWLAQNSSIPIRVGECTVGHLQYMKGERLQLRKRTRGFTLIEIVFALFLLATGAIITTAALPIANTQRARADMQNKAVGLAQKEIEAIRGLGYANATGAQLYSYGMIDNTTPLAGYPSGSTDNTYSFTNADSSAYDNPARLLPSCTARVRVIQVDIDLKQVSVTVTWVERGVTRTFTDGTLIANL